MEYWEEQILNAFNHLYNFFMTVEGLITLLSVVGLVSLLIFWKLFKRDILKCHILIDFGESFKEVKVINVNPKWEKFEWEKRNYAIDLSKSIFDKKMRPHLYYRIDKPIPLSFNNVNQKADSKLLSTIVKSDIYKKIFGFSIIDKYLLILIIALGICLAIVAVYAIYTIGNLQKPAEETTKAIIGGLFYGS